MQQPSRTKRSLLRAVGATAVGGALGLPQSVFAQAAWPNRPIRFVIPWPPGGGADLISRMISEKLTVALGQPIVIDNKAGAGGIIGSEIAANSPPDGYTMLFGSTGPNAIYASLYEKLPYNPLKDFTAITQINALPLVVNARTSLEANSITELIALAKARPGKLTVASVGAGTAHHLAGETLRMQAGVDWIHVPYKGSGPAFTDLLAGQIDLFLDNIPSSKAYIDSGKLKPLAVTSLKRSASLPNVPAVAESGLAGFDVVAWQNILVPAGTPAPIVERLNAEIVKILRSPEISERLTGMGATVVANSVEDANRHIHSEAEKWGKTVKAAGVKITN